MLLPTVDLGAVTRRRESMKWTTDTKQLGFFEHERLFCNGRWSRNISPGRESPLTSSRRRELHPGEAFLAFTSVLSTEAPACLNRLGNTTHRSALVVSWSSTHHFVLSDSRDF